MNTIHNSDNVNDFSVKKAVMLLPEYGKCLTEDDRKSFVEFAERYYQEYIFVRDMNGCPVVVRERIEETSSITESGVESKSQKTKYTFIKVDNFILAGIKDSFMVKDINPKTHKEEIKKIQFAKYWLETNSPICRAYDSAVFEADERLVPLNSFNFWTGHVEAIKGDVSPFYRHIERLVLGSEEQKEHLIKLIAFTVKYPYINPETAIVFTGKPGAGKTTISEVIRAMCPNHSMAVGDIESDLFGQWTSDYQFCKYFLSEESVWSGSSKTAKKLLTLISEKYRKTSIRYIGGVENKNIGFHIFTSNSDNPIRIEKGDRRFNVYSCSDSLIGNTQYFDEFYLWLKSGGANALVHHFKNEVDLTGFNPRQSFNSSAKDTVKLQNLSPVEEFIYDLLNGDINMEICCKNGFDAWESFEIKINKNPLYEAFVGIYKTRGVNMSDYSIYKFSSSFVSIFKFPENYNSNWKDKSGRYWKLPKLSEARRMFCESITVDMANVFPTSKIEMELLEADNESIGKPVEELLSEGFQGDNVVQFKK